MKGATENEKLELIGFNYFDFNGATSDHLSTNIGKKVNLPAPQNENTRLQLTFEDGKTVAYTPLQFHFHAPSEHTVNGKHYDLEVHFVHKVQGTGLGDNKMELGAVIGIFFDVEEGGDQDNTFIKSVFEALETTGAAEKKNVALRNFLNTVDFGAYWSYPGSLTTPPCTEGINWSVVKHVQPISKAQLAKFTELLADDIAFAGGNGNNRAV